MGGLPKKKGGGAWTVCQLKGGLGKKEVDTPMHTMHTTFRVIYNFSNWAK